MLDNLAVFANPTLVFLLFMKQCLSPRSTHDEPSPLVTMAWPSSRNERLGSAEIAATMSGNREVSCRGRTTTNKAGPFDLVAHTQRTSEASGTDFQRDRLFELI
jgi:hypothetical protein